MDASTKNTTAETWRQRVVGQQASGQSIRDWCRASGCHEHAFYWWRAKLGLSPVTTRKPLRRVSRSASVGFTKLVLKGEPLRVGMSFSDPIRVSLLGGRELMLPSSMPVEQIARLLRAIEGAT
jgi:hypothetical protein